YSFTGAQINTAAIVANGKVDAGAMSDLDWKDFLETPEGQKGDVVVFHETGPILRSTILARASLAAGVKDALMNTLLTMHEDDAGKDVMKEYNKISQYDAIAGSAATSLAMVRELYPTVAAEIH
ncbi:MAG: PhnD/SsuA/transferrin family substrate-binding protein, partial [Dongiaceae bacterium]